MTNKLPWFISFLITILFFVFSRLAIFDSLVQEYFIPVFATILAINTASSANFLLRLHDEENQNHNGEKIFKKTRKEVYDNLKFSVTGITVHFIILSIYPGEFVGTNLIDENVTFGKMLYIFYHFGIRYLSLVLFSFYLYSTYELGVLFSESLDRAQEYIVKRKITTPDKCPES